MSHAQYAVVDEQGRLVLPPDLLAALGLSPGSQVLVESYAGSLQLRPPVTFLRRVYIELTNGCNLNCSTCMRNVWEVETGCMAGETFERILSGIQSFQPPPEIFFGGYGEPLSHPGCLEMIARARSLGLRVSMITNGILLTEQVSRRLVELELDMLWVSLDGASPEAYLDVRLGDALPQIIGNLKTLRRLLYQHYGFATWTARPRLGIAFVAMRRSLADLPKIVQLGASLGASEYSVTNVLAHNEKLRQESLYTRSLDQAGGRAARRWKPLIHFPPLDLTPKAAGVVSELLQGDQQVSLFGSEAGSPGDRCPFVERGSITIRWDGKASPCLPLLYTHTQYLDTRQRTSKEYFVGDVSQTSLAEIWNSDSYLALRKSLEVFDFSPCVSCNSCEMADQNLEDCFGNLHPTCGGCLWAQGLIRCP